MECERVREEFIDRLTGGIDPDRGREIDAHLASCTECRAETDRLRAIWEELKFDAKHLHDIERLAMVGPRLTDEGMGAFQHPFPADSIEYFEMDELDKARHWIGRGCVGRCQIADAEQPLD